MLPAPRHLHCFPAYDPFRLVSHLHFLAAVLHTFFSPHPLVCTDKSLSPQPFLVTMPKIVPAMWPGFSFLSLSTCHHRASLMSTEYLVLDCTELEPSMGRDPGVSIRI